MMVREIEDHSESMAEQKLGGYSSRYRFTGKELDPLSGLYDFGARYYDPRLSVWFGVDPMAHKGPQFSPYIYCFNNPIKLKDPDGRWPKWIPTLSNGKLVLMAERNDNAKSLQQFLKGSRYEGQAESLYNARKHNIGTHVSLPESNYSRALTAGNNLPTKEQVAENESSIPENYNCYQFAINGAWEKEINAKSSFGDKLMDIEDAGNVLKNYFEEVSPDKAIFGETLIGTNYSKESDLPQHLMVYAGRDSNGNIMVMDKPGDKAKPQIIKMKDAGTGSHTVFKFYNEKAND
ncbi:MAG TPA: RHS repeat-associated core domain-containing protein [Saprospiraceae bacterium]|nr:RHS repeat-associated core domain-containing protein [Saprospiraceae bacterium]